MSLSLGKTFDRSYNLRLPFLRGFYDIGVYYNKKSSFLLFRVDPDFGSTSKIGTKINMFKNLESSKFCEIFLKLHNYRKNTLDIRNQFTGIKDEYLFDINFIFNETISLFKVELDDKVLFDTLTLYGFCLSSYEDEFAFIIAERQNIVRRLNKKVVRTTGMQIATSSSISILNEFYDERQKSKRNNVQKPKFPLEEVIKLDNEG